MILPDQTGGMSRAMEHLTSKELVGAFLALRDVMPVTAPRHRLATLVQSFDPLTELASDGGCLQRIGPNFEVGVFDAAQLAHKALIATVPPSRATAGGIAVRSVIVRMARVRSRIERASIPHTSSSTLRLGPAVLPTDGSTIRS